MALRGLELVKSLEVISLARKLYAYVLFFATAAWTWVSRTESEDQAVSAPFVPCGPIVRGKPYVAARLRLAFDLATLQIRQLEPCQWMPDVVGKWLLYGVWSITLVLLVTAARSNTRLQVTIFFKREIVGVVLRPARDQSWLISRECSST